MGVVRQLAGWLIQHRRLPAEVILCPLSTYLSMYRRVVYVLVDPQPDPKCYNLVLEFGDGMFCVLINLVVGVYTVRLAAEEPIA